MADVELVIKIPEEDYHRIAGGFGQEEDAILLEKIFKRGTTLPKGHGRLIDADALENVWHEEFLNGMNISSGMINTFNDALTIIEADKEESEDARDAEITDAYQSAWETVLYVDTEHNLIVTKAQLFEEFKAMVDTGTIDDGTTFSDYLVNCTDKNGTLVRVK